MSKYVTAAEAVKVVKSGDRIYLQAAAAAPTILANALTERASELMLRSFMFRHPTTMVIVRLVFR